MEIKMLYKDFARRGIESKNGSYNSADKTITAIIPDNLVQYIKYAAMTPEQLVEAVHSAGNANYTTEQATNDIIKMAQFVSGVKGWSRDDIKVIAKYL